MLQKQRIKSNSGEEVISGQIRSPAALLFPASPLTVYIGPFFHLLLSHTHSPRLAFPSFNKNGMTSMAEDNEENSCLTLQLGERRGGIL